MAILPRASKYARKRPANGGCQMMEGWKSTGIRLELSEGGSGSRSRGEKKISCNGYRFPPRMRALKSSSDFRSWVNSDFRDMVIPANLVSLGFGSRAEIQTESEPHIVKSAVYACQRRSRGPGQCGRGQAGTAPHKVSPGWDFREGAKFPAPGSIPCSGSNSALKFPARLRREFCKKTMQYQRVSHTPFA